jgi:hypothetical protein
MKHLVHCWEMGSDLGHITPWVRLIPALKDHGVEISRILKGRISSGNKLYLKGIKLWRE